MGQEEILEPFRYVIGLVDLDLAGLAAPSGRMLMLLCAPVAAGLALAASLRAAGPAGAPAGLVLLLAGLVGGYLAAGAVQLCALTGATTVPAGTPRWRRRTGTGR